MVKPFVEDEFVTVKPNTLLALFPVNGLSNTLLAEVLLLAVELYWILLLYSVFI